MLGQSVEHLLDPSANTYSNHSTTIIRSQPMTTTPPPSSILTVRPLQHSGPTEPPASSLDSSAPASILSLDSYYRSDDPPCSHSAIQNPSNTTSLASIDTFHTANSSSIISTAAATEGGSTIRTLPLMHRFTLIKPGTKRASGGGGNGAGNLPGVGRVAGGESGGVGAHEAHGVGWNPLDLFFSSGLLMSKCDICTKRLGWKPMLECDDCGLR
jgi:LIM domain kinase 1